MPIPPRIVRQPGKENLKDDLNKFIINNKDLIKN